MTTRTESLNDGIAERPHPWRPSSYPRRVLLCAAGLSPPVITETLYALTVQRTRPRSLKGFGAATQSPESHLAPILSVKSTVEATQYTPEAFVPTEILVVTTSRGRAEIVRQLLGKEGWFNQFLKHYPQPNDIRFDEKQIRVISHRDCEVDDLESVEDSLAAGTTIVCLIKELIGDTNCSIHASIAGGRRQMSYLLGMTMSLLGREQDRLSHVLVQSTFETQGFYYPTPTGLHKVNTRDHGLQDAANAKIVLAEMPLLRVFDGMAESIISGAHSFENLVVLGQKSIERPQIEIDPQECQIKLGTLRCSVAPREAFVYTLLALRRVNNCCERGVKPSKAGSIVLLKRLPIGLTGELADYALRLTGAGRETAIDDAINSPENFRVLVAKLNRKFVQSFGQTLAERIKIVGPGGCKDGHYGLLNALPEELHIQERISVS